MKKLHKSDPNLVSYKNDNTLYPHINNDIEYGLLEDIIDSYYIDSEIKDNFMCDQNCYTKTKQKQQGQSITPCTHAYDHITQYISNLENSTQQHTVYTHEVDASLFTTDTTTPCDYNITDDIPNSDMIQEGKAKFTQPMEIHSKTNISTEMFLVTLISNIMILIMVMHSLLKINIWHYYNKNYKIPIGVYMTLSQPKVTKYLLK